MVDLGQKGWKQFHLFYWNKVKDFYNIDIKKEPISEIEIGSFLLRENYFSKTYLLVTSTQFITLKKASI